ncbi:putative agmatinase 3 [Symbiodinium microadriaticum]|uniref:Putative agmatinase 3 n=1 Tax=Symbiodinium microadriaticum TaxID=2951 RepID=A0A1Q9C0J7_SYMMI|nr:putative agmatinase 3 [Symbiodinium microadriaticum]
MDELLWLLFATATISAATASVVTWCLVGPRKLRKASEGHPEKKSVQSFALVVSANLWQVFVKFLLADWKSFVDVSNCRNAISYYTYGNEPLIRNVTQPLLSVTQWKLLSRASAEMACPAENTFEHKAKNLFFGAQYIVQGFNLIWVLLVTFDTCCSFMKAAQSEHQAVEELSERISKTEEKHEIQEIKDPVAVTPESTIQCMPPGGIYFPVAMTVLDVLLDFYNIYSCIMVDLGNLMQQISISVKRGLSTDALLRALEFESSFEAPLSLCLTAYTLAFNVRGSWTFATLCISLLSLSVSVYNTACFLCRTVDFELYTDENDDSKYLRVIAMEVEDAKISVAAAFEERRANSFEARRLAAPQLVHFTDAFHFASWISIVWNMRRVRTIAGHVHGNGEGPLWAALMDSGHDPLAKPRLGCRCSADKWQYVCNCYPCLLRAGREEDFEWTPGMIDAGPASLPWQWRRAEGSLSAGACSSDLPKDPPSKQEPLVTQEHAGVVRLRRDGQLAPLGPAAPSVHPRFAGIATFARLPQLHELRSFAAEVSSATLEVRSSASTASTVSLSGPWHAVGSSTLSLRVASEDGCVHIRSDGGQKTLGLWALPWGRWHRIGALDLRLTRVPTEQFDIAFLGVPFDSGCSFRPGARFGPEAIRSNSRLIRPYMRL